MNRLFDFFFTNGPLRFKAYLTSLVVALLYASANLLLFQREEQDVMLETIGVVVLTMSAFVLWHVLSGKLASGVRLPNMSGRIILSGAISLFFIAALPFVNIPSIQAYVADAALHHYYLKFEAVEAATLSPDQVQTSVRRIQSIVAATEKMKFQSVQKPLRGQESRYSST